MKIDLGNFEIRSYRADDKLAMIKYADNEKVSINLLDSFPFPYNELEADMWLSYVTNQNPEFNFAISDKDELIGAIGLKEQYDVYRYSFELGYWLGEPHWGKGIMTKAIKAFTEYAFNNYKAIRLFAGVFEYNSASGRVLEKAGYKIDGRLRKAIVKKGKAYDQIIYSIISEENIKKYFEK
ncbi:GNAT family N-acetyltransferase [Bacteroidota bacterium]